MKILPPSFYKRSTVNVAQDLIGTLFIREYNNQILSGIITETEAYQSDDPACHAFKGKTKRNQSLFGPVGHAYVYFTYGCHYCLNVVAHDENVGAGGVLIRAIKPIKGIEIMEKLRRQPFSKNLTNGPGKLTQALAISKDFDGYNVTQKGELYIVESNSQILNIKTTPRIGISKAKEKLWRFII